ncbi:MAG: thioredoxin domain-containing protein [Bacteriovoracaceae bacterium]
MNRLNSEKSLYLKQHAQNPIHWWPYSEDAIKEAKAQNKLIFLSIGYSACHWCHVMAHESFEDQKTAEFLNDNYVCIKVDREEMPDVDQYYQKACQFFGRNGGWPLSVFLTPDMKPFFVGTYFPKETKQGMPSFMDVASQVNGAYKENSLELIKNGVQVKELVEAKPKIEGKVEFEGHFPHPQGIMQALAQYQDKENGGYGAAPRFPHFAFFEWTLEQLLEGHINQEQGNFLMDSLEKMMMGGIYDHLRGGIHRYSTDAKWLVPHFEKMLYDQSGMLKVLSKASIMYPTPLFFDAMIQTLDYLENEMLHEDGYFMSAQDADSEGQEGLYFTFSKEEFEETLMGSEDEQLMQNREKLLDWFAITDTPNFEHGLNVISLNYNLKNDFYGQDGWDLVRKAKQTLLENRKCRIPPATDNKGVASWNFMLVTALLDVIQYCRIEVIRNQATHLLNTCLDGIHKNFLVEKDNSTVMRHTTTKNNTLSYFEDYAFFTEMQFRLYEMTGDKVFKQNVEDSIVFITKEFYKEGFFYTRAISSNNSEPYGNIAVAEFDASFKSPVATFLNTYRRFTMLEPQKYSMDQFQPAIEYLTHKTLQHPMAAGESLRALTYPQEAYRKIEIPSEWAKEAEFKSMMMNFSGRFVLSYHERGDHFWQICSAVACDMQGKTFEEFKNIFGAKEAEAE